MRAVNLSETWIIYLSPLTRSQTTELNEIQELAPESKPTDTVKSIKQLSVAECLTWISVINSILNILPFPNVMLVSFWGFGILFKLFLGPALLWLVRCNCHVWGSGFARPFFYRSIGRLVYSGWDPCQISGYLSLFSANCVMTPSRGEVGPILLLSFQFLTVLAFWV